MMKLLLKVVGGLLALVVLAAGAGLAYLFLAFPKADAPGTLKIEATPERLARGQYLARHVSMCIACHSERDWSRFAGPLKPGTEGRGGERFVDGIPGVLYAKNITPAAIGAWTDGELIRSITGGVSRDLTPLFPLMAYQHYGRMAEDDVHAMVAYTRTLAAIEGEVPERTLRFPMNLITRTIPAPPAYGPRPPATDVAAHGAYLVNAALCEACHTPIDTRGQPLPGRRFSGGTEFSIPPAGYRVRAANITPDMATGIGSWTEQQFIDRFRAIEQTDHHVLSDAEQRENSVMPWSFYAGMTREDLAAIYHHLRTVPPVSSWIERYPDARAREGEK